MAIDTHPTAADEARAALAALDTAETELRRVRAHLERVSTSDVEQLGITHQARRCAASLAAAVDTAVHHTTEANRLAAAEHPQLRSVS